MRECGLKHEGEEGGLRAVPSLPVRECGLKLACPGSMRKSFWSLPVRECGLKHHLHISFFDFLVVTPRAGVWIETFSGREAGGPAAVTPRAGVWIETPYSGVREGGLKVTPRAGVWIETWTKPGLTIENSHSPCGSVD